MIKNIFITLSSLNCINMILSHFLEGGEGVYILYYLTDEYIIILYNILCFIMFSIMYM